MSWSLTTTDENPPDAQRKFDNLLAENELVIPTAYRTMLSSAAAAAVHLVPPTGCGLTLGSSGHVNKDGTGNCSFTLSIGKLPDFTPPDGRAVREGTQSAGPGGKQADMFRR